MVDCPRLSLAGDGSAFGSAPVTPLELVTEVPSAFVALREECMSGRKCIFNEYVKAFNIISKEFVEDRDSHYHAEENPQASTPRPTLPSQEEPCTCGRTPGKQGRHKKHCARSVSKQAPSQQDEVGHNPSGIPAFTFDIRSLLSMRLGLVDAIPFSARAQVAHAFERACCWGLEFVLLFPKLVLRKQNAAQVRQAALRFARQDLDSLFKEAQAAVSRNAQPPSRGETVPDQDDRYSLASDVDPSSIPANTLSLASRLIRKGWLSRASKTLDCVKFAEFDAATTQALQELHPNENALPPTQEGVSKLDPFTALEIKQAISSFGRGSSAGPSGLSRDHLKFIIETPGFSLLEPLARCVTNIFSAPDDTKSLFFGAKLFAIVKKSGGLRPIACGELFRRIAGKVLMHRHGSSLGQTLLRNGQVAIGLPGGSEAMYLACKEFTCSMSPSDLILKIDVTNAFNSVPRSQIRETLVHNAHLGGLSEILHYFDAAYGSHTSLLFGDNVVLSRRGVQQGDPLGPVLFSIFLSVITAKASEGLDIKLKAAFLDDLVVGGNLGDVETFYNRISASLAKRSMFINPNKCLTISPCEMPPLANIPHSIGEWEVLGIPIGDPENFLQQKLDQVRRKLAQFEQLPSPHLRYFLLRYCGVAPMVTYWVRTLGPHKMWVEFDNAGRDALASSIGPIDTTGAGIVTLPIRMGGLGLRLLDPISPAAHLAVLLEATPLVKPLLRSANPTMWADLKETLLTYLTDDGVDMKDAPSRRIQKFITSQLDTIQFDSLVGEPSSNDRVNIFLTSAKNAPRPILAPPVDKIGMAELPGEAFVAWIRYRLCQPLLASPQTCPLCRTAESDVFGDHVLKCMATGHKNKWHTDVLRALFNVCSGALLYPAREVHCFPQDYGKRLDLVLPRHSLGVKEILVDVSVTGKFLPSVSACLKQVASAKVASYGSLLESHQELIPVIFSAYGAVNPEGLQFIDRIVKSYGARFGASSKRLAHFKIHSALAKDVATSLARGVLSNQEA